MLLSFITLITVLANLVLGLFALQKNPKNATNKLFFLFCLATVLWTIFNYFSLQPLQHGDEVIYWLRAHLCSAILVSMTFSLFIGNFPHQHIVIRKKWLSGYIMIVTFAAAATLSPFVFKSATELTDGRIVTEIGILMPVFALVAFGSVGGGIAILVRKFRHSKRKQHDQLRYMLLGTSLMFALILSLVFVPVVVYQNSYFTRFLPIYTFPFLITTAYAITRHSLFDIRPIIARSVAYTLLLGIISIIYVGFLFGLSRLFFNEQTSIQQVAVYTILTLFVATTYHPLKEKVEKLTERIFYKNQYSSNDLISQVTSVMAETLELEDLTKYSLEKIMNTLQITHGSFWVESNNSFKCVAATNFSTASTASLNNHLKILSQTDHIIVADEDGDNEHKNALKAIDASIAAPLHAGDVLQGILLLGAKKSGEIYTEKDISVLKILGPGLATALENARSYKQISEFNETLEHEVESATRNLKLANEKLSKNNEKLRQLDKLKDEFISITSHELRTPLTAIRSYLWMAQNGRNKEQKFEEYMDRAYVSTERLITMVNDTLDVSRIESGRVELSIEPTDLNQLAQEAVDGLRSRATQRHQELTLKKLRSLPLVDCDSAKIYQVLTNLIGNALKFTPENGKIIVEFSHRESQVIVKVKDNGPGIKLEDQDKLFQKFSRLESDTSIPGTGLGLYLCLQIIKLSKGRIWVESKPEKGTTFLFTLPVSKNQKSALQIKPRQFRTTA